MSPKYATDAEVLAAARAVRDLHEARDEPFRRGAYVNGDINSAIRKAEHDLVNAAIFLDPNSGVTPDTPSPQWWRCTATTRALMLITASPRSDVVTLRMGDDDAPVMELPRWAFRTVIDGEASCVLEVWCVTPPAGHWTPCPNLPALP